MGEECAGTAAVAAERARSCRHSNNSTSREGGGESGSGGAAASGGGGERTSTRLACKEEERLSSAKKRLGRGSVEGWFQSCDNYCSTIAIPLAQ